MNAEELKKNLSYDPETGIFTWIVSRGSVPAGTVAGTRSMSGYLRVKIGGSTYYAHRLAHLYMAGKWPEHEVDHVNGQKDDNRWVNLRDVTGLLNCQNQTKARKGSSTGVLGVSKFRGRFKAQITVKGKQKFLGLFDSEVDASDAYRAAKAAVSVF